MSDIFLSYASEDESRVRKLAQALDDCGWSVFWDRTIPPGTTWREVIGSELQEARCVLVLWSKQSVAKHWVLEEADHAKKRNVLIPVLLDQVEQPLGFSILQAATLVDWDGNSAADELRSLINSITQLVKPPSKNADSKPSSAQTHEHRVSNSIRHEQKSARTLTKVGLVVLAVVGVLGGSWLLVDRQRESVPKSPVVQKETRGTVSALLNSYKIGIYFKDKDGLMAEKAGQIRKNLIDYGFKGTVALYPRDEVFFRTKVFEPRSFEIRYETPYENEVATQLYEILRDIYPSTKFTKMPVTNRPKPTTNFISIFLARNSS